MDKGFYATMIVKFFFLNIKLNYKIFYLTNMTVKIKKNIYMYYLSKSHD